MTKSTVSDHRSRVLNKVTSDHCQGPSPTNGPRSAPLTFGSLFGCNKCFVNKVRQPLRDGVLIHDSDTRGRGTRLRASARISPQQTRQGTPATRKEAPSDVCGRLDEKPRPLGQTGALDFSSSDWLKPCFLHRTASNSSFQPAHIARAGDSDPRCAKPLSFSRARRHTQPCNTTR